MTVYLTTNLVNGKIYVGKTTRKNGSYLGSGLLLRRAIIKYGKDSFSRTVLEVCHTMEDLNRQEIFWIGKLNAQDPAIGYNLKNGGEGGWFMSPEVRKKTMTSMNENLGEEGRAKRSQNAMRSMGVLGLSKRAEKIVENLGKDGLVKKAIKGNQTLGEDGRRKRALAVALSKRYNRALKLQYMNA